MIMGTGANNSGGLDLANLIKPALQNGEIKCIGSTTFEEYRQKFQKDAALNRRFTSITVDEPTVAETKEILKNSSGVYEQFHAMEISQSVTDIAVELSNKYMLDKKMPDKAFDLLDSAASRKKLFSENPTVLTEDDVKKEVSLLYKIPYDAVGVDSTQKTPIDIEKHLSELIFGQSSAIEVLSDAIYISQAGLKAVDKPIASLLFTGPTGVGKTEVVKQLSDILHMKMIRFDMSEYQEKHSVSKLIGSPPGYVGYGDGDAGSGLLINEIEKNPSGIILLDEVEKSHPDVLNILLQLMDNGVVSGSDGKSVNARNCMVIMTSNLGAAESEKNVIGFGKDKNTDAPSQALKKFFSPEFRNRLDAVVEFNKLSRENIILVAKKFLNDLKILGDSRGLEINWDDSVEGWLADKGFDPLMGARPMHRAITDHIKKPMAKKILFSESPSSVSVSVVDNQINIRVHEMENL